MTRYLGSGPYCYTHSLAMVLGPAAPEPGVLEFLTGSPFGVQLLDGHTPYFDPCGWDPEIGLAQAVAALGFRCDHQSGGTPAEALGRLREACARGPVLIGPVDMGLLSYQPDAQGDHYVVALEVTGSGVLLHDPHGHPYATLPVEDFLAAWRAESVAYVRAEYGMRTGFERVREVDPVVALRDSLPLAVRWLSGEAAGEGTLGGAAALAELADQVDRGLDQGRRDLLAHFVIRVGARRLADAAVCLARLGLPRSAAGAEELARGVGGLQLPVVIKDDVLLAQRLRALGPKYESWLVELSGRA